MGVFGLKWEVMESNGNNRSIMAKNRVMAKCH